FGLHVDSCFCARLFYRLTSHLFCVHQSSFLDEQPGKLHSTVGRKVQPCLFPHRKGLFVTPSRVRQVALDAKQLTQAVKRISPGTFVSGLLRHLKRLGPMASRSSEIAPCELSTPESQKRIDGHRRLPFNLAQQGQRVLVHPLCCWNISLREQQPAKVVQRERFLQFHSQLMLKDQRLLVLFARVPQTALIAQHNSKVAQRRRNADLVARFPPYPEYLFEHLPCPGEISPLEQA